MVAGDNGPLLQVDVLPQGPSMVIGSGAGHVAGLPGGGPLRPAPRSRFCSAPPGRRCGRAQDGSALLPALGAHQSDPLPGQELSGLREGPLGLQPGAGARTSISTSACVRWTCRAETSTSTSPAFVDSVQNGGYDFHSSCSSSSAVLAGHVHHIMIWMALDKRLSSSDIPAGVPGAHPEGSVRPPPSPGRRCDLVEQGVSLPMVQSGRTICWMPKNSSGRGTARARRG